MDVTWNSTISDPSAITEASAVSQATTGPQPPDPLLLHQKTKKGKAASCDCYCCTAPAEISLGSSQACSGGRTISAVRSTP